LLISVRLQSSVPVYSQIAEQIKDQIRTGSLQPEDELPSVRDLASVLGVNMHTVHRAYEDLRDEGVIILRLGRKARVAPLRQERASAYSLKTRLEEPLRRLVTEAFHLGLTKAEFLEFVEKVFESDDEESGEQ
jgi:GntR family transcriptional regulator